MKRILITLGVLLALSTSVYAGSDMVTIPADDYKAILQKLDALQKRVDSLEKKGKSPSGKAASAAMPSKLAKDVENIYATLDEVETKTLKDRVNFGVELRTRVDNFKVKNHTYFSTPGTAGTQSNDNSWSNRFRLNMDAQIRKNLLFTGRLAVLKNFADSDTSNTGIIGDSNRAHISDTSTVKLDRAYVDWIPEGMPVPLAFTFGRHPSSEGPPFELRENRKRQSTYPALLFDGEADGVVATVGLERYIGWKDSGLRFAWGKSYQDDDDVNPYLDKPGGLDDSNIFAAFFETGIPGVKDSLLVFSALRANDLVADFTQASITGLTEAKTIGDMDLYGIHAQANNVVDSGFDVFLSFGLNESHPNGQYLTYSLNGAQLGLLTDGSNESHTGWAAYAGMRYTVPYKPMNNPKIGFEYNHGSDYWFSFTSGSTELYNKMATRGDAYEVYYIQPFNDNLFMRAGFTWAEYNYMLSGFPIGDFGQSTEKLTNGYLLLDCRF